VRQLTDFFVGKRRNMPTTNIQELLDRPIAFHRCFVKVCGSVTAALFLSQALYWSKRTGENDGWFYKTQTDWEEETGLSRREQETARKNLRDRGILLEKQEGLPQRLYFKLDEIVLSSLMACTDKDGGNRHTCMAENAIPIITETTTETTDIPPVAPQEEKTEKPYRSKKYLQEIPDSDLEEFKKKFVYLSEDNIRYEAEKCYNHWEAKGRIWKDYKAMFRNWLSNANQWKKEKLGLKDDGVERDDAGDSVFQPRSEMPPTTVPQEDIDFAIKAGWVLPPKTKASGGSCAA
jgi:hypothetical protein